MSMAGGRSNRTLWGVRGVWGSSSGGVECLPAVSSSSEELSARRPISSSFAGLLELPSSRRIVFGLALAMLRSLKHLLLGCDSWFVW